MTEIILNGLSRAVAEGFPKGKVYYATAEQGLKRGDFVLSHVSSETKEQPGGVRRHRSVFDVLYFPKSEADALQTGDLLFSLLRTVPVGTLALRNLEPGYEISDGVLHFSAVYCCYLAKKEDTPTMEGLTYDTNQ